MAEAATRPAGTPVLSVGDLQAWYGESHILHGINFNVKAGEVVTLLGRNGAGKTTTLKSIMGIIGKRTGSIRFNGQDITRTSSDKIAALIKRISAKYTILMVEHNLSVVANLSDIITVLTRGQVLAEGNYADLSKDERVKEAYLGAGHD